MSLGEQQVLVTGGAGFVGSHVSRRLVEAGARVHVIDNLAVGRRDNITEDATLHEVDLRDASALVETLAAVDPAIVIHLAAHHYIPYCNAHPEETFDVNVMGTRNLLEAATSLPTLERVVYASTAAVYPPSDEPHAEADDAGPTDVYGRTKLVGEDLVERFHAGTGVPATSARLFNVYGTNETNPHLIPAILDQLTDGPVENGRYEIELGNLAPQRDFVHVADVADALLTLATDAEGYRAYNVGTGTAHSVRGVVDRVSDVLGTDIELARDDERVRESDRPHLRADTARIERELGWTARTALVDGLRELIEAEGIAA